MEGARGVTCGSGLRKSLSDVAGPLFDSRRLHQPKLSAARQASAGKPCFDQKRIADKCLWASGCGEINQPHPKGRSISAVCLDRFYRSKLRGIEPAQIKDNATLIKNRIIKNQDLTLHCMTLHSALLSEYVHRVEPVSGVHHVCVWL
jgi:hypothetical protein